MNEEVKIEMNHSEEQSIEQRITALSAAVDLDLSATLLSYLGPESFIRMLKSFHEEFEELVEEYKGDASWELEQKRRFAHSLKSAAANIGAVSLASLATQTELDIKEGNATTIRHLITEADAMLGKLGQQLTEEPGN